MGDNKKLTLKWKRPATVEYPKVWHTFMARDTDSNEMIEYRIEDLTKSKADDVFNHMLQNYIQDEPVAEALGAGRDPEFFEDYKRAWNATIEQHVPLVCLRAGSDDIVGANFNFVMCKEDNFTERFLGQLKGDMAKIVFGTFFMVYENFDPYEKYGVNEIMGSLGLSVDRKYRGRGIGDQFLATRKLFCKEFNLKITQTIFTSNFSNRNADNVGFKTDVIMEYEGIIKANPHLAVLKNIKSRQLTLKTLVY